MNLKASVITPLLWLCVPAMSGDFANLSFEDIRLPPRPTVDMSWQDAIPGWYANGGEGLQHLGYDATTRQWNSCFVFDRAVRGYAGIADAPIVGQYALAVVAPPLINDPYMGLNGRPFHVDQFGTIPSNARSLEFVYRGDGLNVSIGESLTPVFDLGVRSSGDPGSPWHHYYGVDVTAYAGQSCWLRFDFFTNLNYPLDSPQRYQVLDGLRFSPEAIPEAKVWLLLLVGAGLLWRYRRC
jgi:hypothetical protein